jgi:gliding motility-associated-like protein
LDLGPDIEECEGETVVIAPGVGGVQYLWQDGSTTQTFITSVSTTVILEIQNGCGMATDTLEVIISGTPPTVDLGADQLLCDGEALTLTVDGTGSTIEWQDGSNSKDYNINNAGTYWVSLTNMCGVAADTILVETGLTPASFDLGPDVMICAGDAIVLNAPVVGAGDEILWSDGSSGTTLTVDSSGTYVLSISNACGLVSDMIIVNQDLSELEEPGPDHTAICPGEVAVLNAQQLIDVSYLWSTGAMTSQIEVLQPGTYGITVTSDCQILTSELIVEELNCSNPNVFVPNIFSPNGDGINDVFRIDLDAQNVTDFQVFVYDRWGEVVFGSINPDFEWEGDYLHRPLLPGVYVYYVKLTRDSSRPEVYRGDVTLIR